MSWQMPGGITIKDPSLVIIPAIGDEDEETHHSFLMSTQYFKVEWPDCNTFFWFS